MKNPLEILHDLADTRNGQTGILTDDLCGADCSRLPVQRLPLAQYTRLPGPGLWCGRKFLPACPPLRPVGSHAQQDIECVGLVLGLLALLLPFVADEVLLQDVVQRMRDAQRPVLGMIDDDGPVQEQADIAQRSSVQVVLLRTADSILAVRAM